MQEKRKCCRKNEFSATFFFFVGKSLLGSFHGDFTEFLEVLHEFQSGFAGAGTGGLVTFHYLSLSVLGEFCVSGIDFFNKLFHVNFVLLVR